jgi:hypothetical protein
VPIYEPEQLERAGTWRVLRSLAGQFLGLRVLRVRLGIVPNEYMWGVRRGQLEYEVEMWRGRFESFWGMIRKMGTVVVLRADRVETVLQRSEYEALSGWREVFEGAIEVRGRM